MSWIGWVIMLLAGSMVLFQLYIYLQSKRLVGKAAPPLDDGDGQGERGAKLIYFHSPNCGPCRKMTPLIEELASDHGNVVSVDVSQDLDTARKYQVRATPTTVLVRDGRVSQVLLGFQSLQKLQGLLSAEV